MRSILIRRGFHLAAKSFTKDSPPVQYTFKLIQPDRYQDVVRHMEKHFYTDEPVSKAVGLATGCNPDFERYILETLDEKLSVMVVTDDDKIAGAVLSGYFNKISKAQLEEKMASCETESFRKVYRILHDINSPIDLFSKFSVDTVIDMRLMAVASSHRRKKLGAKLLEESEPLLKKTGLKVIKAEVTGEYSHKLLRRAGFKVTHEIFYNKYVNESGIPLLEIPPPHESIKFVYRLMK